MKKGVPTEDILRKMYWGEGKTIKEIEIELGIAQGSGTYWMREFGVPFKTRGFRKQADMVGKRFGRRVIIGNRNGLWEVKCDCGSVQLLTTNAARARSATSCGCYKEELIDENRRPVCGEISKSLWLRIQRTARYRNHEFGISPEYAWSLFVRQNGKCALSGLDIGFAARPNVEQDKQTASLDRIDSDRGYVEGNVQWVHKDVNVMKLDLTEARLLELCRAIVENNSCQTKATVGGDSSSSSMNGSDSTL